MPQTRSDSTLDRRDQIMAAALSVFTKRGFHQTSMHDISAEAGISVGLIYRYFANKEAVIAAMGDEHKRHIRDVLDQAREAPSLLESLEVLFTAHCCEESPKVQSVFVVDLYSEASRNPQVAEMIRDVTDLAMEGLTDLIARAPETESTTHGLEPRQIAELIYAVARGMLMRDILQPAEMTAAERRERQLEVTRRFWRLLFNQEAVLA
ncbi:MAG TPA: TetR/AcrR family transcriptional regulator [Chthoniobacterales bacterium]